MKKEQAIKIITESAKIYKENLEIVVRIANI